MDIIITLIFIFAGAIIGLSFFNLRLSVALYISYLILVPYLEFSLGSINLSYNLVNTLLFVVFLYHIKVKRKSSLDFTVLKPFLFLFGSLFFLSLFAQDTPWDIQFNYLRLSFMKTCLLAFIIWNFAMLDDKILIYIKRALIISFTISCVYGIYLMQLGGVNPYTSFLALYFGGKTDVADLYSTGSESRLSFSSAGKIQATMIHPMTWGMHLCLMTVVIGFYIYKEKKIGYFGLAALLLFNLLISGVRTGIAAIVICGTYYLLRSRQFKLIVFAVAVMLVGFTLVNVNKDLSNIVTSFTDISGSKSNVKGSTIAMRLDQLQGAMNEIKGREMYGKGYGWTSYYQLKHGDHPVLLAFESLIFVVLCNSGILGMFIWLLFFLMLFKLQRKILKAKADVYLMDTIIVVYVAYATGTGEYGYIEIFSIYYVFLMCSLINVNKIKQQNQTEIYE